MLLCMYEREGKQTFLILLYFSTIELTIERSNRRPVGHVNINLLLVTKYLSSRTEHTGTGMG